MWPTEARTVTPSRPRKAWIFFALFGDSTSRRVRDTADCEGWLPGGAVGHQMYTSRNGGLLRTSEWTVDGRRSSVAGRGSYRPPFTVYREPSTRSCGGNSPRLSTKRLHLPLLP